MDRRSFLTGSSALGSLRILGLNGCKKPAVAANAGAPPALPLYNAVSPIVPIRADVDRIFRITVCLRPFRATGPRLDVENVGGKVVVHNYGHGGSGWSLSWGSAEVVVRKLMAINGSEAEVAVIGCGALGLTAALTAQRAGARVTIYARERPPFVRSSRATGSWTPDSRVALSSAAGADFPALWEQMARTSLALYQGYLGLPGTPVEWADRYILSDISTEQRSLNRKRQDSHGFAMYGDRIADLTPASHDLPPGSTPFPTRYVRRTSAMTFNVSSYSHLLMNDFQLAGGKIETREFHSPEDLAALPQRGVINCTGYGARQLWSDESITPVRGQIAWLVPQEGVNYALSFGNLNVLGRRDGIVIQPSPQGDDTGWNDSNEQPDKAAAIAGVEQLQDLYKRMEKPGRG